MSALGTECSSLSEQDLGEALASEFCRRCVLRPWLRSTNLVPKERTPTSNRRPASELGFTYKFQVGLFTSLPLRRCHGRAYPAAAYQKTSAVRPLIGLTARNTHMLHTLRRDIQALVAKLRRQPRGQLWGHPWAVQIGLGFCRILECRRKPWGPSSVQAPGTGQQRV